MQRSDQPAAYIPYSPTSASPVLGNLPPETPTDGRAFVESSSRCTRSSILSESSGSEARRESARELFDQYGIVRPPGWLSDEGDDAGASRDGNASPREKCRICHMCSGRVWSSRYCSACGHRLCNRCLCEVPGNAPKLHEDFTHHPERTISLTGSDGMDLEHSTGVSALWTRLVVVMTTNYLWQTQETRPGATRDEERGKVQGRPDQNSSVS